MIITIASKITIEHLNMIKEFLLEHQTEMELVKVQDDTSIYYLKGNTLSIDEQSILALPDVLTCQRITPPYYLSSIKNHHDKTIIKVNDVAIGGNKVVFIAGPCSVESTSQLDEITKMVKASGATILRAGAFKPRTSPYFFQGLGEEGLSIISDMKAKYHIPTISEITSLDELDEFKDVDILQIGARNMQNYELLKGLGKQSKPVLLKRGPNATIEELLLSSEYILKNGNPNVILCERGIRTFEKMTRYTLDLSAVAILKNLTHLPIVVDPSHALGDSRFVESLVYAAVAVGADGIMVEVHTNPSFAKSDGNQALKADKLQNIIDNSRKIANALGRTI